MICDRCAATFRLRCSVEEPDDKGRQTYVDCPHAWVCVDCSTGHRCPNDEADQPNDADEPCCCTQCGGALPESGARGECRPGGLTGANGKNKRIGCFPYCPKPV